MTAAGLAGVDLDRVELGPVELPDYEPPGEQPTVPAATCCMPASTVGTSTYEMW